MESSIHHHPCCESDREWQGPLTRLGEQLSSSKCRYIANLGARSIEQLAEELRNMRIESGAA